ncbi:Tyrosine-protein kinase receptor Tie-1 [Stylophora pistillata]|uniref:Tyrosine-protein kinase receptor Tie-1 n=1 Tax=Stylophora pistillata TaxID=50429 RepID=A0A2B4R0X9_STYPI|nr:Tyrosine-protein kinase receptor Tie-1 [Stylophora pistillata]
MAASFHGSYSEVLSRIPPKDPANISNYNISFKGKLIENVKVGSCYETAVKFSLIAETGNASNTDRTGYMYRCNESYYRPSNVTDCEGVTGIFYGAVIGSTATAVVGAGILFFVWKLRERNSKNSNGQTEKQQKRLDSLMYDIMTNCWKDDPDLRPSFESLRDELKEMEDQRKGLINLDNYDDRLYVNADDLVMQSFEFS